ncbi:MULTISPECIES: hypothetical protein [unclassified Bifidobacterium]|uniref:hypothetical protein n=1 Tax=unclassified Bifidobacterium TaxID=2608897 RepID=UPI00112848A3|nr:MULTISPECIES: hypothetical protein [unclassified Bifidobacterium]TPF79658.1 hypothetical protein BW08_08750 [Bifidobacterium sp. UTCIF-24]TPF83549.1 hypothetical protein BW07_09515 [Bifidobacterium sp. UTCIF-36]TPF90391.1 hypothetical protein BW10_03520 [Bifidobacterium sp. UTBIF-56]
MNAFSTNPTFTNAQHNPAAIDPIGGFAGNTVTPFSYGTCPCHAAVERSRNLIGIQRSATRAVNERFATASTKAKGIVWTGNAAELFRTKLDRIRQASAALESDMDTTERLSRG